MLNQTKHTLTAWCGLLLLCFTLCNTSLAQNVQSQMAKDLQVQFLKDSIEADQLSFQFNNCNLYYAGAGMVDLEIKIVTPPVINIVASNAITYLELASNQNKIIPIRFNLDRMVSSETWYAFALHILVKQTGQTVIKKFWVRQKSFTKWRCNLPNPDAIIRPQEEKVDFPVRVENTGSKQDTFEITFSSELEIEAAKNEALIILPPGKSKTVVASAHLNYEQRQKLSKSSVNIFVSNKSGEKRMLVQYISRLGNRYRGEEYSWKKFPLLLELNGQYLASGQKYYSAAVNGTMNLGKERAISLQLQSYNINKGLNADNSFALAEYSTRKWKISAGTIRDFNHFMINGTGAKVRYHTNGDGFVELAGIKGRMEPVTQIDFRFLQPIQKKWSIYNNTFVQTNNTNNTKSTLTTNKLSYHIDRQTHFSVEAGAGAEQVALKSAPKDTMLKGAMFGYEFETFRKNFQFASKVSNYAKNFPGFNKGFQYHNHVAKATFNKVSLAGFYEANRKIYTNVEDSVLKLLFNINNKEYGVRSGFASRKFSVNISGSMFGQQQDSVNSLVANMKKLSLFAGWQIRKNLSLSLFSNFGMVNIKERPDIKPFKAFTNFGSIQSNWYGIHFRYDVGPFYYYEIKNYINNQQPYKRLQVAPYAEHQFKRANLFLRTQLNYTSELPYNFYILANNQLVYTSSKLGMDLGLNTNINLTNQQYSMATVTIRKKLEVPVIKNAKSRSFTLYLYQDRNRNNKQDGADRMIANANVFINGKWLQTDAYGKIEVADVSPEPLTVDFSRVNNLIGWMPVQGLKQTIMPSKKEKKVYVAFKESKTITGKLVLVSDEKSNITMSLDNIRITVTDNKTGLAFSTLTDQHGEYNFNLPAGNYMVSVNEAVFDSNFRPIEFSKIVDLQRDNTAYVTFEIIQKKRQINIKKSN